MINTAIGVLAVAIQRDRNTAAGIPSIKHGLIGGGLIKPERSVDKKSVACGLRADAANSSYVDEVNLGVDFETMAYADAIGLYTFATMGNIISRKVADASPGSSAHHQHTITLGSKLPYLTFWGQVGDAAEKTVQEAIGCKIDKLALNFENNAPLTLGVTAAGVDAKLFGTWDNTVKPSSFDGYFVPTDGEFLIDTASQTPVKALVTKGGFEMSNGLTPYRSAGRVVPTEIAEGKLTTSINMTVIPDDWSLIRKVLTGSDAGTSVTSKIVYGSATWNFTHSQNKLFNLKIHFENVPWTCEMPEVDPDGDAAEIEFSADNIGISSETGSPVVITLDNATEKYVEV